MIRGRNVMPQEATAPSNVLISYNFNNMAEARTYELGATLQAHHLEY
jgi:hypothetical protein